MDYPYDEIYLASVQNNLGFFFQIALRSLRLSAKEVQDVFLASDVPTQLLRTQQPNHFTPKLNIGAEWSSPFANGN